MLIVTGMTEIETIADASSLGTTIRYQPTRDEVTALRWLGDRYAVATVLRRALVYPDSEIAPDESEAEPLFLLTADEQIDIGEALRDDGIDRVPCLDESTTLARIVWAIGPAEYGGDEVTRG